MVGTLAGIPVIAEVVNAVNRSALGRKVLDAVLGVHPQAPVPPYHSNTLRKQLRSSARGRARPPLPRKPTDMRGKVALFATCYGNRNEPQIGLDLARDIRAQRHRSRAGGAGRVAAECPSSSWAICRRLRI